MACTLQVAQKYTFTEQGRVTRLKEIGKKTTGRFNWFNAGHYGPEILRVVICCFKQYTIIDGNIKNIPASI